MRYDFRFKSYIVLRKSYLLLLIGTLRDFAVKSLFPQVATARLFG